MDQLHSCRFRKKTYPTGKIYNKNPLPKHGCIYSQQKNFGIPISLPPLLSPRDTFGLAQKAIPSPGMSGFVQVG